MNNKDLCIASVAHGPYYEGCIPVLMYSAAKTCPGASVKVFLSGEPMDGTREALKLLDNPLLEVIPNEFRGYKMTPRAPAMWRYLLFTPGRVQRYFKDFECVHIGDVDSLICPEEPPFLEQHLRHCEVIGLPYSGFVRVYEPLGVAGRVFYTREYIELVQDVVMQFDVRVQTKGQFIFKEVPRHPDEHMSYRIADIAGLPPLPQLKPYSVEAEFNLLDPASCDEQLFCSMHGIHLGFGRVKSVQEMYKTLRPLFETQWHRKHFAQLLEWYKDPLFRELLQVMPDSSKRSVHKMIGIAREQAR